MNTMADPDPPTSRAQQRQQTKARILAAARQLFAERGYDRTTIRAVAAAAGVDAGLVMHYYGSKDELFQQAAYLAPDQPIGGTPQQVAERLLASLGARLDTEPVASLAMLRSMLTHPEAVAGVQATVADQLQQISNAIQTDDALLRASLISAITMGVVLGRYQLRLDGLHDADPNKIIDLLRPCFHALTHGDPAPQHPDQDTTPTA
jgi:AcrR family transcriptional regulator